MKPYLVLGVGRDSTDEQIRKAYLDAVKEATPEANPERFKAVTHAYDQLKDEQSRHGYELFNQDSPGNSPIEVFASYVHWSPPPVPLSFEAMKQFLRSCSKA